MAGRRFRFRRRYVNEIEKRTLNIRHDFRVADVKLV